MFMCGQQNNGPQRWPCPNPRTWKHIAPTWQKGITIAELRLLILILIQVGPMASQSPN